MVRLETETVYVAAQSVKLGLAPPQPRVVGRFPAESTICAPADVANPAAGTIAAAHLPAGMRWLPACPLATD
jgi:hypothetical protein